MERLLSSVQLNSNAINVKDTKETLFLIDAIQNGEQDAVSNFYHLNNQLLMRKTQNQFPHISYEIIEDAFHDALLVLIDKYIRTRKIRVENGVVIGLKNSNVLGLLYVIMKNNVIQYVSIEKKYNSISIDDYLKKFNLEDSFDEESTVIDDEQIALKAFKMLRPLCQEIVSGRLLNGLSFREISEELGGTENLRRQENFRCMKQLKRIFERLKKQLG